MDVRNCIGDLLSEHDCVIIPGFGGFIGHYTPARIDPLTHTFYPPSKDLLFNINLRHNDGLLATEVSKQSGLNYHDACSLLHEFAMESFSIIQSGESLYIPRVGRLYTGAEETIQFEQNKASNLLPESFGLHSFISPPVSRSSSFVPRPVKKAGKPMLHRRRSMTAFRRWAAIMMIPVTLAALAGILKYDNLGARLPAAASFFNSVLSRFSATSLTEKKNIKPQETNLLPVDAEAPVAAGKPEDTALSLPPVQTIVTEAKPPVEKKDCEPESRPKEQHGYVVIIGAFRQKENAEKLVGQLKEKGMHALIYDRTGSGLYRVALASLPGREEAVQLLTSVQSSDFPDAWLLHQ